MPLPTPDCARLFLALWPDTRVRAELQRHGDTWCWPAKAAPMRAEKLHLTLHFIGDVERTRLAELLPQLHVPFEPFSLQLGYPELWPHGIAVLRPHGVPAGLMQLHARLGSALQRLELPVDTREFRPHITLARRAQDAALPPPPPLIDWHVDCYVLVESQFDARRTYTVLEHY